MTARMVCLSLCATVVLLAGAAYAQTLPTVAGLRDEGNVSHAVDPSFRWERFDPSDPWDLDVRSSTHSALFEELNAEYMDISLDFDLAFGDESESQVPSTLESYLGMDHLHVKGTTSRWAASMGLRFSVANAEFDVDDPTADFNFSSARIGVSFGLAYNAVIGRRWEEGGALTHTGWGVVPWFTLGLDYLTNEYEIDPAGGNNEFEYEQNILYLNPRLGLNISYMFSPNVGLEWFAFGGMPIVITEDLEDASGEDADSELADPSISWGSGVDLLIAPKWAPRIEFRIGLSGQSAELVGDNDYAYGIRTGIRIPF